MGSPSKDGNLVTLGNEIGLLKAIYKNEGWEISSKRKICEREGEKKLYVELHFNKN
jgi:hypothetical protein